MRVDLTDLRLFVHVGETLNLTRAAERTFLSLPAASTRIKNMEDAFGMRFLIRKAHGVELTPAGSVLLGHALAVFRKLECLNADLQPYSAGLKGRLRVRANMATTNSFLADALSSFLSENQDVDIELEEGSSGAIVLAVRGGSVDLGIVAGNVDVTELDILPLCRDELVVVADLGHPLTRQESVRFVDALDQCRFVGISGDSAIQSFLEETASSMGKRMSQRVCVGNFDAAARIVEAGGGIAVMPRACVQRYRGNRSLRIIAIEDDWALRERFVIRQRGRDLPRFAEHFINHVLRACEAL